ncbi:hypothetical protein [Bradyrhizobium sp.]|uniref:hypothetical protein n=1 Tax=Bradyrhizobium sp. TaxID=376 RepID=UPI003C63348D
MLAPSEGKAHSPKLEEHEASNVTIPLLRPAGPKRIVLEAYLAVLALLTGKKDKVAA